jgi:hypothetical protein
VSAAAEPAVNPALVLQFAPTGVQLLGTPFQNPDSGYSGSRIAVPRTANAKLHFPQENATFHHS